MSLVFVRVCCSWLLAHVAVTLFFFPESLTETQYQHISTRWVKVLR